MVFLCLLRQILMSCSASRAFELEPPVLGAANMPLVSTTCNRGNLCASLCAALSTESTKSTFDFSCLTSFDNKLWIAMTFYDLLCNFMLFSYLFSAFNYAVSSISLKYHEKLVFICPASLIQPSIFSVCFWLKKCWFLENCTAKTSPNLPTKQGGLGRLEGLEHKMHQNARTWWLRYCMVPSKAK